MAEQLAYVLINPYTLRKSRTGGILSRLLTRTTLDLAASRLFAPSQELVEEFAEICLKPKPVGGGRTSFHSRTVRGLIYEYLLKNYSPDPVTRRRHRALMLLFRGEDAVAKVQECVGDVSHRSVTGETIRDTYGDYLMDHGKVKYFEPAVLAAQTPEDIPLHLRIWAKHSDREGGLLKNILPYPRTPQTQRTLVLIKPDNFTFPSGKPGNVMDMFSRTGLYIVAFKVQHMSVAQAEAFYQPVLPILLEKYREISGNRAYEVLKEKLGFQLPPQAIKVLGDLTGPFAGRNQFEEIVRFMSGCRPSECKPANRKKPGTEKCLMIVYEGEDAVAKVRKVLGPTDPRKAPPGSIRREFGQNIMINTAHASDSPENARREMKILNVAENNFKTVFEKFYGKIR